MSTTQDRVTINITDGTKKLLQKDFQPFKTEQIKRINIPRSVEEIANNTFSNLWGAIVSWNTKTSIIRITASRTNSLWSKAL